MFSKEGKAKDVATPRICDVVWHDGQFIKWNDARVHVMSHVLHYGSSIFEGIRCYATKQGPAIFRLREHGGRRHEQWEREQQTPRNTAALVRVHQAIERGVHDATPI